MTPPADWLVLKTICRVQWRFAINSDKCFNYLVSSPAPSTILSKSLSWSIPSIEIYQISDLAQLTYLDAIIYSMTIAIRRLTMKDSELTISEMDSSTMTGKPGEKFRLWVGWLRS